LACGSGIIVVVHCVVLRSSPDGYVGIQGGYFFHGVSAESTSATRLCLHVLTIPPHTTGTPHIHAGHESAIYVISGTHEIRYGDGLDRHETLHAGDMVYIPPDVPHMPVTGAETVTVLVARTDPNEQESIHLHRPAGPDATVPAAHTSPERPTRGAPQPTGTAVGDGHPA
jgi:uncharacterized RmlC-like cupin family protein